MKNLKVKFLLVSVLALAMAALSGCSHKAIKSEDAQAQSSFDRQLELNMVHFAFDSSVLSAKAKAKLSQDAAALKLDASAKIQVQGYCDQRGGIQYNMALGARRARVVMRYLNSLGITPDRMTTISYGKSNPLDSAQSEQAYAKNRRASFAVQTQNTTTASR